MGRELAELEEKLQSPVVWSNQKLASSLGGQVREIKDSLALGSSWNEILDDVEVALELGDEDLMTEVAENLKNLEKELDKYDIQKMLSGEYDDANAILTVNAGAGGTDAQDWASMLLRMYTRWAENKSWKVELLDKSDGEEAGIKSATIKITGKFAYGYAKAEKGVHRLVRLSPFDSAHRRHTSFALVEVLPEVTADDSTIQINPEDIRIDVYKSSGAGGQNVQKNATAVRITHFPTGLVVSCQNERSQMQNRDNALKVLKSKLLDIQREEMDKQLAELRGEYTKAEWGSQIRSYVLHPYQMVKDHRTEFEVGNTLGVLDGDINGFIESYLKSK